MKYFLTKLIAIETLEEFQSCLVTGKVYRDSNSLLAMVLLFTAGLFGYGLNNLNSSHRNTWRLLLPVRFFDQLVFSIPRLKLNRVSVSDINHKDCMNHSISENGCWTDRVVYKGFDKYHFS